MKEDVYVKLAEAVFKKRAAMQKEAAPLKGKALLDFLGRIRYKLESVRSEEQYRNIMRGVAGKLPTTTHRPYSEPGITNLRRFLRGDTTNMTEGMQNRLMHVANEIIPLDDPARVSLNNLKNRNVPAIDRVKALAGVKRNVAHTPYINGEFIYPSYRAEARYLANIPMKGIAGWVNPKSTALSTINNWIDKWNFSK